MIARLRAVMQSRKTPFPQPQFPYLRVLHAGILPELLQTRRGGRQRQTRFWQLQIEVPSV